MKKKGKKAQSNLSSVMIALCTLPIVVEVIRIALDGEPNGQNMGVLAAVSAVGLSALLGQKWAVRLAPIAFGLAAAELLIFMILTSAPIYYWAMLGAIVWAGGELAMAPETRNKLSPRSA